MMDKEQHINYSNLNKEASMAAAVKIIKSTLASVAVVALTAPLAFAQDVPVSNDATTVLGGGVATKFRDVSTVINTIFKVVISAAGAIFVLMFLFGGIQYLTSAGNEEGATKARRLLVDAIVGLIIVLAAYALGTWILGQLGLTSDTSTTTF